MTITFKEVGQGDSIIFEWYENQEKKIGIIDCNKKENLNPVLEQIKKNDCSTIEFIILTHPHFDHFSGLYELLDYIEEKKGIIKKFLHTCASKKEYLQSSIMSIEETNLLSKIFKKANEMHDKGLIPIYGFVNDLTSEISLLNNIKMKFLSPSHKEYSQFNKKAFKNNSLLNNNPDANYLSTLIKIYTNDWYSILSSDVVYDVFWRLNRLGYSQFNDSKCLFAQIPHHGSKDNYYKAFWKSTPHDKETNAVISVGKNSYGHPSNDVIEDLKLNDYKVKLTNAIVSEISVVTQSLDMVSEKINIDSDVSISGDIVFHLPINN